MGIELLNRVLSIPLEREFEGWITWMMLDYFESSKWDAKLWAVSPADEDSWPADEHMFARGKIIGLQFKRPKLADLQQGQANLDFGRLKWNLGADSTQFRLVKRCREIFYCLPTFISRDWRRLSLHHCIFWRPTRRMGPRDVWYDNPQVRGWSGRIDRLDSSFRWGAFVERIQQCDFGYHVTEPAANVYLDRVRNQMAATGYRAAPTSSPSALPSAIVEREPLVFINLRMPGQGS